MDAPGKYGGVQLATDVDVDVQFLGDPAVTVDFEDVPADKMDLVEER